jgi:hypothetical protein
MRQFLAGAETAEEDARTIEQIETGIFAEMANMRRQEDES